MDLFFVLVALFFCSFFFLSYFLISLFIIIIFILITFIYLFIYLFIYSSFLSFFLPFILSQLDNRVLVLWLGVGPEPLRWESRVQDIGTPETS